LKKIIDLVSPNCSVALSSGAKANNPTRALLTQIAIFRYRVFTEALRQWVP
jgi:hypothetical protein